IGAPVRAVAVEQAEAPLGIAKQHEILAQNAHRPDRANGHVRVLCRVEFVQQRHGLPVAAQQLTGGRARANPGQPLVVFGLHACLLVVGMVAFLLAGHGGGPPVRSQCIFGECNRHPRKLPLPRRRPTRRPSRVASCCGAWPSTPTTKTLPTCTATARSTVPRASRPCPRYRCAPTAGRSWPP